MDTKIPLARKETERRTVLLARSRIREVAQRASRRDQGQTQGSHAKENEGGKIIGTKKKSQGNAENQGRNRRGRKRGRAYSLRESIREAKGRNPAPGRTAQELGITWLDTRCEDSPVSKAHHLVARTAVDEGYVFECRYCHRVEWLPDSVSGGQRLNELMKIYGLDRGYQKMLDEHPAARRLISKIQDIYYLKKVIPEEQFPIAVAAVMLDREYPYDVTITEEDVL